MKTLGGTGVHSSRPVAKIPRREEASDLKISQLYGSELDMESNAIVSNATLYSLLQTVDKLLQKVSAELDTVHANQTQIIIPDLAALDGTALRMDLAAINATLITMGAKLDQIIAQVTPPETGDSNVETAKIS
jgi:hypothetical protein